MNFTASELNYAGNIMKAVVCLPRSAQVRVLDIVEGIAIGIEAAEKSFPTTGLALASRMDKVQGRAESSQTAVGRVVEALID